MKIKKLIWRDNVTEVGKTNGLFQIISDVDELDIHYSITNKKDNVIDNKFHLSAEYKNVTVNIVCYTVDDAKHFAQEHFKDTIHKLFFEK
jgi:hypothetical protein